MILKKSSYKIILFFQFGAVENGMSVTKLMQIFSRQAAMMDALISHFTEMRRRKDEAEPSENAIEDGKIYVCKKFYL